MVKKTSLTLVGGEVFSKMGIENLSGLRNIPKFGLTLKFRQDKVLPNNHRVWVAEHSVYGVKKSL